MKELKDILHLYLGCDVICFSDSENPAIKPVKAILCVESHNRHGFISLNAALTVHAKPILRPLSNMIEEELTASKFSTHPKYWHNKPEEYHFTPIAIKYLLSKHFDLFGLIEAGLAIDKTTLK